MGTSTKVKDLSYIEILHGTRHILNSFGLSPETLVLATLDNSSMSGKCWACSHAKLYST